MEINNKNGLTVIVGYEKVKFLEKTYDVLTAGAVNQYTYYFDRFNTNIMDAVYYHTKNKLNEIMEETQKRASKGNKQPVVVLMTQFDRMQSLKTIEDIKIMIRKFINDMPVPTHVYVSADTYEMCRGEEILVSHTGDVKHFVDYENYREFMMSI